MGQVKIQGSSMIERNGPLKTFSNAMTCMWGSPEIDLFASRLNTMCSTYIAWKPDPPPPQAAVIDAFTLRWDNAFFCAFPPFSMVSQTLQEIEEEKATGNLVVSLWSTQPWFAKLIKMLIANPVLMGSSSDMLTLPGKEGSLHSLRERLILRGCLCSGKKCSRDKFQKQLPKSFSSDGGSIHRNNMQRTLRSRQIFSFKGN